jgi:hypothetical protein
MKEKQKRMYVGNGGRQTCLVVVRGRCAGKNTPLGEVVPAGLLRIRAAFSGQCSRTVPIEFRVTEKYNLGWAGKVSLCKFGKYGRMERWSSCAQ